jgi:cysteine desulfurase
MRPDAPEGGRLPLHTHPGLVDGPIYLDYNATTPIDPEVVEAMLPWLSCGFGNPSSTHAYGAAAHAAVARARGEVAQLIGAAGGRVVFTGSGSEADALAVRGAVLADSRPSRHVITQATEHPAVLAACAELREVHDVAVTVLPVDGDGVVDPAGVARAVTDDTVLVTIMHANNETGVRQPVREIVRIAHDLGVLVHCDAAQSIGKVDVDVRDLGVDLLTVVGHKMYAPKGIAALYVGEGVPLRPLIGGGGQEGGLRAGTENVPYIVGLGQAARVARRALVAGESGRLACMRDLLARRLREHLAQRITVHGQAVPRLPSTLSVGIQGIRAPDLLARLPGVAASAGSACHAGEDRPSPVLAAMGVPADRAMGVIRLSVGRWTTAVEIERAAALIGGAVG